MPAKMLLYPIELVLIGFKVSIHTPAWRDNKHLYNYDCHHWVSTHTPTRGATKILCVGNNPDSQFLSTRPRGARL